MLSTTKEQLRKEVLDLIQVRIPDRSVVVNDELPLIGGARALDSMNLVELCLALEDKASEMGFEFNWTSESAMSRTRSIFRTAGSLANEFISQMESAK
jgi:acyl carrier protein